MSRKREYTDEDIERGLNVLAIWGNNAAQAVKTLKAEHGLDVPRTTLKSWANETHADRYQAIRQDHRDRTHKQIATESEDLVKRMLEVQATAIEKLAAKVDADEIDGRDLSNALRNIATAIGIHSDKARVARDMPTAKIDTGLDANDLVLQLARLTGQTLTDDPVIVDADVVTVGELEAGAQ